MKNFKNAPFLFFYILSLVRNTPPPIPEKMYEIVKDIPTFMVRPSNLFKRLDASNPSMDFLNSTLVTNIYDDYRVEEHQLIITAKNLPKNGFFPSWGFTFMDTSDLEDIKVTCRILDSTESCTASKEITKNGEYNVYKFSFTFKLHNDEQLIIEHSHKIKKSQKQILFKEESVTIPLLSDIKFCNYKYTIPEGYKFLGFKDNFLKKESNILFTYKGECPTEQISDIIRFSPEQSMWKADVGIYLKSSNELKNSIKMKFPRHYRGGKNRNSFYKIFSTEGKELNENEFISDYTFLSVDIPGANTTKLGVDIHTAFTNKLSDKFDVYFPEKYYQINENNIDKDIKAIAEQIINNKSYYPGKQNYYKLGRFVNNYMTYDLRYGGMNLTPKEIYNLKAGVCEHFTILYNEMLNSIGIKTLYVSGWAFSNNETSGNKDTISHAWTVALIDGNWIELDATWGLFEGIPAGHILKGFFNGGTSISWSDKTKASLEEVPNIVMIADSSELKDPTKSNGQNTENPKEDTTNTTAEKSTNTPSENSSEKTESDNITNGEEDEEGSDTIKRIRFYNKSNKIKISLISLFIIYLLLLF